MKLYVGRVENALGTVEQKRVQGRDYLVAPVTAMVEGLYHGEFVSRDEMAHHVDAWNGRPLVLYHPKDAEGNPISANSPDVLERHQIGMLFNFHEADGKLKGEAWVDMEKALSTSAGTAVVKAMQKGDPMEVSTSYWRDAIEKEGEWKGEKYHLISANLKPDHLAVLPDIEGECSLKDGCGLMRNQTEKEDTNIEKLNAIHEMMTKVFNQSIRSNGMDEKITALLGVEGFAFDQKALEAMSEEQITQLHSFAFPPEPEVNEDEEAEEEELVEDEAESDEEIASPDVSNEVAKAIEKIFEPYGGLECSLKTIKTLQANEKKRKAELVNALVANKACKLDKSVLETMDEVALKQLQKSFAPADYSGQGGGLISQEDSESLVEYGIPSLVEAEA